MHPQTKKYRTSFVRSRDYKNITLDFVPPFFFFFSGGLFFFFKPSRPNHDICRIYFHGFKKKKKNCYMENVLFIDVFHLFLPTSEYDDYDHMVPVPTTNHYNIQLLFFSIYIIKKCWAIMIYNFILYKMTFTHFFTSPKNKNKNGKLGGVWLQISKVS